MKKKIPKDKCESILPKHLGGHFNVTHIDESILLFFKKLKYDSYLDIGCGPGEMLDLALNLGYTVKGIDGDFTVIRKNPDKIIIHDYTTGPLAIKEIYQLVWSCEFVEHVYEEFLPNFMKTFQAGRTICLTYAPPGKKGHHHVNLKPELYWINVFDSYGLKFDNELTMKLRFISSMKRDFFRDNGLVFQNKNLILPHA